MLARAWIPDGSPACLSQRQVYCKTGKIKKQERSRTSAHKGYPNVTHFCEILGKEMTNQEADNKPCSECPITYRNKESLNEKKEKGKMLIISIVILFMGLVYMGAIGVETFSRSLIFIMISIVELFLIVYADRKDFEEKRKRDHSITQYDPDEETIEED